MLPYKLEITQYALIYFLFTPIILCEKLENKNDNNRSKRTVGLFLQSLASFLNVQDVEATTPITFTTSAPGYRRKAPPSKVQKWPPLDLEITPWVLSAVPTTTASPLTTSYPTTTTYPPTEEPGIHAQVIIIPLTEPENHLKPPVGYKKEPEVYLQPKDVNRHPLKYTAVQNYQNTQPQYQATLPYYSNPSPHQQTEVYFWQRLVPDQRTVKQIHYLNQQQPVPYQQLQQTTHHQQQQQHNTQLQTDHTQNQLSYNRTVKETSQKPFQLQPKEAETLFRLGYLYGQTIKDELNNLAGNDFNREKQDKYRSFIDLEPKFNYNPTASTKNNDLAQLYLLERSRRLKNVNNIMKLGSNRTKLKYLKNNDDSEKTDVEIVKSVEPVYFNIGFEEHPKEEKESVDYKTDTKEKLDDSPAFEMVKSYELPNSEVLSGNKDFEFHMDPEEKPEKNIYLNNEETFYNVSETNKIISPLKNKKITFIPPSERQRYDRRKNIIGYQNDKINNYLKPDKVYQDVYDDKQYSKYGSESFRDIISNENPKQEITKQEINYNTFRNRPVENPYKQFSYEFTERSPSRGKVKYHQHGVGFSNNYQRYNDFISKYQSQKSLPSTYNNHNNFVKVENSDVQPQSHDSDDPTKLNEDYNYFNRYNAHTHNYDADITDQNIPDTESKLNKGVDNNYNFSLQNPDAQLHIFIPDEQSLQSPEKQDKPLTPQQVYNSPEYYEDYGYQQEEPRHETNIELKSSGVGIPVSEKPLTSQQLYNSPEYYQDYSYQQAEPQYDSNIEYKSGLGIPRLPDNIHEQINEHNGVRRNLVPPPSFDQETDTSEHKVNCLPLPFTKLKFACKPFLSLKLDQKLSKQ